MIETESAPSAQVNCLIISCRQIVRWWVLSKCLVQTCTTSLRASVVFISTDCVVEELEIIGSLGPLLPRFVRTWPDLERGLRLKALESLITCPNGLFLRHFAGPIFVFDSLRGRIKSIHSGSQYLRSYMKQKQLILDQGWLKLTYCLKRLEQFWARFLLRPFWWLGSDLCSKEWSCWVHRLPRMSSFRLHWSQSDHTHQCQDCAFLLSDHPVPSQFHSYKMQFHFWVGTLCRSLASYTDQVPVPEYRLCQTELFCQRNRVIALSCQFYW